MALTYLHPVFPWEGPNGQGGWVTTLIVAAVVLAFCGLLAYLLFKLTRR